MIKVGLLGLGAVSLKHELAIRETAGMELAVCCDLEASAIGDYPLVRSVEEMLEYDLDLVAICTPPATHATLAVQCMEGGCHVLIEKPITLDHDEALWICDTAEKLGKHAFEMKQYRSSPLISQLKNAIGAGALGNIRQVLGTMQWCRHEEYFTGWRGQPHKDGGVFASQGCHIVDLMHHLGGPVRRLQTRFWNEMKLPCEDSGYAYLEYENGARGLMELTIAARPKNIEASISVLGSEGSVVIGGAKLDTLVTWECEYPRPAPTDVELHTHHYRAVLHAVRNGITPRTVVPCYDAALAVRLTHNLYISSKEPNQLHEAV